MEAITRPADGLVIRNVERQTLGFQIPDLPGEQFRIALPELLSDADQPILPWGFVSPEFEIRDNVARMVIELPGVIQMEARVYFTEDRIKAQVSATNLSNREWKMFNTFTCFACHKPKASLENRRVRPSSQYAGSLSTGCVACRIGRK